MAFAGVVAFFIGDVFTTLNSDSSKTVAISDPKEYLDKEVHRVVKEMPKWNLGEKEGKKVDAKVDLPLMFKLK